jgi:hypothetical protein
LTNGNNRHRRVGSGGMIMGDRISRLIVNLRFCDESVRHFLLKKYFLFFSSFFRPLGADFSFFDSSSNANPRDPASLP